MEVVSITINGMNNANWTPESWPRFDLKPHSSRFFSFDFWISCSVILRWHMQWSRNSLSAFSADGFGGWVQEDRIETEAKDASLFVVIGISYFCCFVFAPETWEREKLQGIHHKFTTITRGNMVKCLLLIITVIIIIIIIITIIIIIIIVRIRQCCMELWLAKVSIA